MMRILFFSIIISFISCSADPETWQNNEGNVVFNGDKLILSYRDYDDFGNEIKREEHYTIEDKIMFGDLTVHILLNDKNYYTLLRSYELSNTERYIDVYFPSGVLHEMKIKKRGTINKVIKKEKEGIQGTDWMLSKERSLFFLK